MRKYLLGSAGAVVLTALTYLAREHLFTAPGPFLVLFLVPILASSLLGGFVSGLVATLLSAGLVALAPPPHHVNLSLYDDLMHFAAFIGVGLALTTIYELSERHRRKLRGDVSHHRRAGTEMERARLRLDSTLLAAELGTFDWDVTNDLVTADHNLASIFQLDAHSAAPLEAYLRLIHPIDRERVREELAGAVDIHNYFESEFRVGEGGSCRWVIARGRTERDSAGTALRVSGVIVDITDRKKADEARRVSEARFRAVLENMSEGVMLFDPQGNLTYQNPASLRIHGFSPATDGRIAHENLPTTWQAWDENGRSIGFDAWPVSRVFRGERFQDQVLRVIRHETGHEFYASYNGCPVYDESGTLTLGFITIREITEQVRAQAELSAREKKLKQSEQRLRTFSESNIIGIIYWNMDGQITDANDRFLHMVGYTRDDLVQGRVQWAKMTPPEYRERDGHAIRALKATGVDAPYEKEFVRADGSRVPVIIGAATLDEARFEGVAFVLDITERKQMELDLKTAREVAERATQAKDRFLAVLSHELRTPLTPVFTAITLMQRYDNLPPRALEHLQIIKRNVGVEARLIDDLLDLTRIVRGKISLEKEPTDIREVILNVEEVCQADIEAKKLRVDLELGSEPSLVYGDPARLQQVFWNLLKNAIKFTPQGGSVRVSARIEGSTAVTEVSDTGIGIEPVALPKIFEAFEQGADTITRQFGGLGLGLAITKRLVEMHSGAIAVESKGPGQGATFRVTLPLMRRRLALPKPSAQGSLEGGTASTFKPLEILLVEDHADTAELTQELLEGLGHRVELAGNAAEGYQKARAHRFDLLISDLGLPDASGIELMKRLREAGVPLKGIAVSGFGREENVRESEAAGFAEHLTKPVEFDALARAIAQVTGAA